MRRFPSIKSIKKCVKNVILINGWMVYFFIMGPLIINIWINHKDNVISEILFSVLAVSLLIEQLKRHTQYYIEVLERYLKQVIIPLEKYPRIIEIEDDEIITIEWTRKKKNIMLLLIIASISMGILIIWGEQYLYQNKTVNGIVTIFATISLMIYCAKNKITKKRREKEIIFASIEYDLIKEEVKNICKLLNIHNIKFDVIDENRINAYSRMNEDGVWEVAVTSQFITKLRKMYEKKIVTGIDDVKKIFLVTIGHELGHVFYKDNILEKWRMLFSILVSFGIWVIAMFLLCISVKLRIFVLLSGMLLLADWIFGRIMCDWRYWGQIAEFKADRIATKYVEGGREAFVCFWGENERIQVEEESTKKINKENVIYKYYKRNLEIEKHPSMKYRRKLIEKRNEWKWWEYFEHALVIRKWRRVGLGWNGVLKVIGR